VLLLLLLLLMMMMMMIPPAIAAVHDALPLLHVDLLRRFPPPLAADLQRRVVLDLDLGVFSSTSSSTATTWGLSINQSALHLLLNPKP
jgi:hypothetical protein